MAKLKSSGSISLKHEYVPVSDIEEVLDSSSAKVHPTPQQLLNSESYIKHTVDSANAIPDDSSLIDAMNTFIAGIPIQVTFYHVINNDTYGRSFSTDFDRELDPVHTSYLKINNFQMMLKQGMSFDYDLEGARSQQSGEAVLYPYFCPNQGDVFLYELPNKVTGLFKIIEAPNRLAIHDTTCHEIKFRLIEYLTPKLREQLEASVAEIAYFNLKRYLADKGALLTSNETNILNKATASFSVLANAYGEEFYNSDVYNSIIEDTKLYDPYIVEFITRVIEVGRLPGYPTQLMPDPKYWKRSFWFKLLDPKMVPDSIMIQQASKVLYKVNYRTSRVNALMNRQYIELMPKGSYQYPPFKIPKCYSDNVVSIPMQVALYFQQGQVRPAALMKLADDVLSMRRISRFYYMPIILFLLKKLILALSNGNEEVILNTPLTDECLQDCENCDYICDRNGEVINCSLPVGVSGSICPHIPACGGSTTDDDNMTTPPPYSDIDVNEYNLCNRVWRQDFGSHHDKHGTVQMFPTDVFYSKEQVNQMISDIDVKIHTPDISTLPDSQQLLGNITESINALTTLIDTKVNKVDDKDLSTNDFTDEYRHKLDTLEEQIEIPDASASDKGIIQIATTEEVEDGLSDVKAVVPSTLKNVLDTKVTKIDNKGLSANDFTNEYKNKLDNIEEEIPQASTTETGLIQIATTDEVETGIDSDKAVVPSTLKTVLDTKVNKVDNKDLSTNDFTDSYKDKLDMALTSVNDASVNNKGIVQLATANEVKTGVNDNKAIVPSTLKPLLDDKVTKVENKDLSTNDFTNAYKQKLDEMGAPVTVADASTTVKGIVQLATEEETLDGENSSKAVVPITLKKALDNKVTAIDGKGLSTNDYTNEDKTKVNNALTSVPDATTSIKGVVQLATDAEVLAGIDSTKAIVPTTLKTELDRRKATDFSVINDTKVPSVKAVSDHVAQQLAKHGLDAAISVEELPVDAEEGKIGIVASGGVFVLYEKGETEWAPLEYAGLSDVSDALKLIRGEEVEGNPIWLNGKDAYQEWLEQGNTGDINDFFNAIGGLTPDEKAKVATINLETLDVLSGTIVNVLPWKQYKWVADGTCTLIVSGWATSGKQVSELLITLTEGSTLGIIGAEVDEEKDAITESGVYSCFLKNLEGIVRFKKVDRWEAV